MQTRFSLAKLTELIYRAVYAFDSSRADHYVRETFVDEATGGDDGDGISPPSSGSASGTVIIYEHNSETYFRAAWSYDGEEVSVAEPPTWTQVQQEWMPVGADGAPDADGQQRAFEGMQAEKQRLMPEMEIRAPEGYQQRDFNVEIRRASDNRSTTVIINTASIDSYGTIIEPRGMKLDRFIGRFFINHDLDLLAGESPLPQMRNGQIMVNVPDENWDHDDPAIQRWFNKVKRGLVPGASIGFEPDPGEGEWRQIEDPNTGLMRRVYAYTSWYLREWSFVSIMSNPDALITARQARAASPSEALRRLERLETKLQNLEQAIEDGTPSDRLRVAAEAPSDSASEAAGDGSPATQESLLSPADEEAALDVPDGEAAQERGDRELDDLVRVNPRDLADLRVQIQQERQQRAEQIAKRKLGKA